MRWENYGLNETIIPVQEALCNDAIFTLRRNYGRVKIDDDEVEQTTDYLLSDIFTFFPILMQELSITRLVDAYAVATHDQDSETTKRTVVSENQSNGSETLIAGTSVSEISEGNAEELATGTVSDSSTQESNGKSNSNITNTADVDETGSHNVSLTHNMPEQSINTVTKNFPLDDQGTPILSTSRVDSATEGFNTSNPMKTEESSIQESTNEGTVTNENTTTNNLKNNSTNNATRTATNSGSDLTTAQNTETVNETEDFERNLRSTNKQYAYEVSAFIKTAGEVVAFNNWTSRFYWIGGLI